MHDVTVSVWNRFHSFPLIAGLTACGHDVLALGTTRRRPVCARSQICWSAALATQASFRMRGWRDGLIEYALDAYESYAARHALEARSLWAWSNHHLAAFERAKAAGRPVILETGSTHARWASRRLEAEYRKDGVSARPVIAPARLQKMIAEYAIADAICVPSRFVASTFVEEGVPAEKLHVNPYGADLAFWSQQAQRPDRARRGPCVFVYCGQIMLRKGIRYLFQAWGRRRHTDAELWLIGHPEPACEGLMSDLPAGIRWLGEKNHREIRDIYRQCDACVLPSLEEGLARSTLEAMAAGLPLIVTAETGVTDIMVAGEDGWVVPHSDADALAAALDAVADDREAAAARGRSAAARVEPFTWEAYGRRAGEFLTHILQKA